MNTVNPLFQRTSLLTGPKTLETMEKSRVIVFGLGGVGGWAAEALVRSGIGSISLVDFDTVCSSNTNRQIQALNSTIGRFKADVLEERLKDINPSCKIRSFKQIFSKNNSDLFNINEADYVIDAIDMITSKLDLIETAFSFGKRLFSSMGMAFKLDPTQIKVADIWKSSGCPLARFVRQGLKKRGFTGHFPVVFSPEKLPPRANDEAAGVAELHPEGKTALGSAVPVTATAGMILASLVIRDIHGHNTFLKESL